MMISICLLKFNSLWEFNTNPVISTISSNTFPVFNQGPMAGWIATSTQNNAIVESNVMTNSYLYVF